MSLGLPVVPRAELLLLGPQEAHSDFRPLVEVVVEIILLRHSNLRELINLSLQAWLLVLSVSRSPTELAAMIEELALSYHQGLILSVALDGQLAVQSHFPEPLDVSVVTGLNFVAFWPRFMAPNSMWRLET